MVWPCGPYTCTVGTCQVVFEIPWYSSTSTPEYSSTYVHVYVLSTRVRTIHVYVLEYHGTMVLEYVLEYVHVYHYLIVTRWYRNVVNVHVLEYQIK
jgi:hypothetical protein